MTPLHDTPRRVDPFDETLTIHPARRPASRCFCGATVTDRRLGLCESHAEQAFDEMYEASRVTRGELA